MVEGDCLEKDPFCTINSEGECVQCIPRYFTNEKGRCELVSLLCDDYNPLNGFCITCHGGFTEENGKCIWWNYWIGIL